MITLLSMLLLAAEPKAVASAVPSTDAAAPELAKEEKKICKRDIDSTSRIGTKPVCLTPSQWRKRQSGDMKCLGLDRK